MLKALKERLTIQKYRTMDYPDGPVTMPERFRGYPLLNHNLLCCQEGKRAEEICPFGALRTDQQGLYLDMGNCLFCSDCPAGACVGFSSDHRLAATSREDLIVRPGQEQRFARPLKPELLKLFRRSLKFREVSAAGCNACEADSNVLTTIGWDMGRFGIQFVASPRHADGLWVTGPISENMREALLKTWEAIPSPKIVVACGSCAISGGPFCGSSQVSEGLDSLIPVDLYIPGCPPHPATILDGLLRLQGRIE